MAIDGRLLARAKIKLDEQRSAKESKFAQRTSEIYRKIPAVEQIDIQLRETMSQLLGLAIGTADAPGFDDIRSRNEALQKKRRQLLRDNGYKEDYLDDEYICRACKDTGYIKSKICDCLNTLYKAEQRYALSNLLKLGKETFDSFRLDYYDDTPAPETGISPRENMSAIYKTCMQYANKWNNKAINLFFNGSTGLGKTFLSACIARVVSDKGYSVVYDTAITIFLKYEDLKFSKTDNLSETREEIQRYTQCDLLILDDLGTELTTDLTREALYDVINTRLIRGLKTIINTNLTIEEVRLRYTPQIASRIEGEYHILTFYGEDIRRKLNNAY